ncbi:hypothetical protein ACXYL9_04500 [Qipengyuania sp. CAU 1752]
MRTLSNTGTAQPSARSLGKRHLFSGISAMPASYENKPVLRNGAILGLLTMVVAVAGATTGDALGEHGMLYRSGHSYDLPQAPRIGSEHQGKRAQAGQYVARTMLVDGKPVGVDPYQNGEYEPLDAQYQAIEETAYIPVDGWTSASSKPDAATGPQRGQAMQSDRSQSASTIREPKAGQVMVVRGTERSIAVVEPGRQDLASTTPRQSLVEQRTRVGAPTEAVELAQQSLEQSLGS